MAKLTKSTGTVALSGAVEKVTFPAVYGWVWVKNMSESDIFAGLSADISEGADGVMTIPAGECGRIQTDGFSSVYLLGTGNVLVVAQNYAECPFKAGAKGGDSPAPTIEVDGFLSETSINPTQNRVITSALNNKADLSDIPSELPANGGNADTVNGHTVNADVPADAVFTDTVVTVDSALSSTSENPVQNKVIKQALDEKALKSKYGDSTIDVGRKAGTTVGSYSTAEGSNTTASGNVSHAEGSSTTASGEGSHAEGYKTTASGNYSHAEGSNTTASGISSHAEGSSTTASGIASHAEGFKTTTSNHCSHAQGHYNAAMTDGGNFNNTIGTAFVIGNGSSDTTLSNAFSVQFDGTVKAKSTITASTTADYAEFFEWLDGNPNGEDRVGYFVTLDGNKIKIAAPDDYILGVVSGEPFVLGNGDCDVWNDMFLRDEFRRTIYEPAPKIEEVDGKLVEIEGEFEGTRPKLNPEYDHTQRYISRFDRPEWAPIGMLGVLAVRHDGTARVNGYVTIADGGIATACERSENGAYRVIKSNSENVVEIIFR